MVTNLCARAIVSCSAGALGINSRLLEMWKDLSDEQRQEFNDRASEIKTRAADVLRGKH